MTHLTSFILLILSLMASGAYSLPYKRSNELKCGYAACHPVDADKLTLHLIPHSHDDVGWLKTFDQYYYGARNDIQKAGVQYIIDSYMEALKEDPDRRFIQVETAYFWKWWKDQNEQRRQEYRDLVNRGQIEITNGAWAMNDEAAVNYQSTIDQFTLGLGIINETLGACGRPKVGWQIDPFGHSREMASLYTQFGFEGFFVGRIDYEDKFDRINRHEMDFLWKGSANLDNTTLFGNVLLDHYTSPDSFCFDIECNDEAIIDDPSSPEYNLDDKVSSLLDYANGKASYLKTSNVLITMGGDFQYQAADMNFINMDRLIRGFKKNVPDVQVIYSTPSCYMKAVHEEALSRSINFTVKTDDFFPYASDQHSYWTGYFSSRPTSKRLERTANNILQAAKQLAAYASLEELAYGRNLRPLKEAMGTMQHHDAITGTEKQHVAEDYARLVATGIRKAEENVEAVIRHMFNNSEQVNNLTTCLLSNITVCETTQWENFSVTVYNPFSHPVNFTVALPVAPQGNYTVLGPKGVVNFLLLPSISNFSYVSENTPPSGREIRFTVKDVPAFGAQYYYINKTDNTTKDTIHTGLASIQKNEDGHYKIGTDVTYFLIDYNTNMLKTVTMNNITLPIQQSFHYYESFVGDNSYPDARSSGAYVFRPKGHSHPIVEKAEIVSIQQTYEDIRVHQRFGDWVSQVIRVNKHDPDSIEFDWLVGPIDVNKSTLVGKEVVIRFTLPENFDTNGTFFTDSNGREMIRRKVDERKFPHAASNEPVSSNYYPITSKITVKDQKQQLQVSVLNDRAQGGTHLSENGTRFIELMVHRRILNDDNFGVTEALNEFEYDYRALTARGQHYLVIGSADPSNRNQNSFLGHSTTAQERHLAQRLLRAPWVLVSHNNDGQNSSRNITAQYGGLSGELPKNVQILTLEPWKDDAVLLRLEHFFEKDEDSSLSKPVTVNLKNLIKNLKIREIRETTLAANQYLDEFNKEPRLTWTTDDGTRASIGRNLTAVEVNDPIVHLEPMQIRTFIIKY